MRKSLSIIIIFAGIFAMLALVSCHPYYNTFYNAEEAFSAAQRKHKVLMRQQPDSIFVEPTGEMVELYKRAIEKSLKMMEVYPRDVKRQDRAMYLMGRAAYYGSCLEGDTCRTFETAVSRMNELQAAFPESPLIPMSYVYVAKAHIMMGNLGVAEEVLLKVLEDYPHLDNHHEITMLLVEIAIRYGGRAKALGLFGNINLSGLPVERRIEIILRMANLQFELRQYPQALGILRGAPRVRKLPMLMYRVDGLIFHCHNEMDSLDAALKHIEWMERRYRRFRAQQRFEIHYEVPYYKAKTLHRKRMNEEAIAILSDIHRQCNIAFGVEDDDEDEDDDSDVSPGAMRNAAGVGGGKTGGAQADFCDIVATDLADIYFEMGQIEMAEAILDKATEYGGGTRLIGTRSKRDTYRRIMELRTPDSTGKISAESLYLIAELYRFELQKPQAAYSYYLDLTTGKHADSTLRPKALMMAAIVARADLGDVAKSDSLYSVVIADYEGTEYARRAQIEMDVEVTVVTPQEAVEREYRTAEAMIDRDMVEAVKAFYNIYKEHPEMDIAPMSLYAAAWYTDNGLGKKRAAMTLYEELCEKYPESDFCKARATPKLNIARDSIAARQKRREEAQAKAAVVDTAAVSDSSAVSPTISQPDSAALDSSADLPDDDDDKSSPPTVPSDDNDAIINKEEDDEDEL